MELKALAYTILENSDDFIYVSDLDTYEVVYLNKVARERLGLPDNPSFLSEKKCYTLFQGLDSPCSFCKSHNINTRSFSQWEFEHALFQKTVLGYAKLIEQDGHLYRMDVASLPSIPPTVGASSEKKNGFRFETVLMRCVHTLKNNNDTEQALQVITSTISDFYKAERSFIYRFDSVDLLAHCTHEIRADGCTLPNLTSIKLSELSSLCPLLLSQSVLVVKEDTPEDSLLRRLATLISPKAQRMLMAPVIDENDELHGFFGIDNPTEQLDSVNLLSALTCFVIDILHKQKLAHSLQQMNYIDSLTGLNNHSSYLRRFQALQKSQQALGVVYIDINGLKKANDTHGHTYGDSLILRVSRILSKIFSGEIYRTGGDEFVVFCINSERNEFYHLVDKLRKRVEHDKEISLSIGARWDSGSLGVGDMISAAEELMYINKQSFYNSSPETSQKHRARFTKELISAIDSGNYLVYLQPKVDLESNTIFGAEALVRMKDTDGKLIPPINFIPMLESENAIRYVDFFVLDTVCRILCDWRTKGFDLIKMSVNFSRLTLLESDVVDSMLQICKNHNINPKLIMIEVTESIGDMDTLVLRDIVRRIKGAGFSVSLDDFGSQYSNFSLLSNVDFDELKFDKSMVDSIASNQKSQVIMRYAIDMGLSLNDTISVAEGIETPEQLKLLLQMNCRYGQGYLFSRPLPIEEFNKLINIPSGLS